MTKEAITKVFLRQCNERIKAQAFEAIGSFARTDQYEGLIAGIEKFCSYPVCNVHELKRQIADDAIAFGGYPIV